MFGGVWLGFLLIVSVFVTKNRSSYSGTVIPKILSTNQSYEVLKGSTYILECKVENLGKFVVLWRKGDRILSAGKLLVRKDGKVKVTDQYDLKLSDVDESDAGEYVCEVDVYGKTKEVHHLLKVLVSPEIHSWERTVEVSAGDDLTIICDATGNPPPKITWRKQQDGKVIIPEEKGRKVVLKNVSRRDDGFYICTADNQVMKSVEKITKITVQYPPEIKIEEVWLQNGKTFEVQLICHVISYPASTVTWFFNENTRLSTSDEIVITDHTPKSVMKIEKLYEKNFGKYKCKARNSLGKAENSIELTGKPRPPIFSEDQREILSSMKELNITWFTDSIAPIHQYILQYRKSQTGVITKIPSSHSASSPSSWSESIIPVEVPTTSLTTFSSYILKNLDNETVYDVRVKALNSFGSSQFSKVFNFYVKTSVVSDSHVVAPQSLLTVTKEVESGSSIIFLHSTYVLLLMFTLRNNS